MGRSSPEQYRRVRRSRGIPYASDVYIERCFSNRAEKQLAGKALKSFAPAGAKLFSRRERRIVR